MADKDYQVAIKSNYGTELVTVRASGATKAKIVAEQQYGKKNVVAVTGDAK